MASQIARNVGYLSGASDAGAGWFRCVHRLARSSPRCCDHAETRRPAQPPHALPVRRRHASLAAAPAAGAHDSGRQETWTIQTWQRRRAAPHRGTRPALRQHPRHRGRHALRPDQPPGAGPCRALRQVRVLQSGAPRSRTAWRSTSSRQAERDGTLKPGQTVVEATSGNTGIGLAMVCAAKGYPLVVTMADSFSVERRQLMRLLGAKVVLTPRALKGHGMYMKAKELAEKHGWFLARQFETAGQRRHPREHDRAGDHRRLRGLAARLLRLGLRHRRHGRGGRAGAEEDLAGGEDRPLRARQRPARELRHPAGALRGRRAGGRALGLRAAPDPGLDAGLHPAGAAGGDRRPLLRRADPDPRPRGHEVGARARGQGRDLHRRLRRRDLRRGDAGRREGAGRVGDPRDAARHRASATCRRRSSSRSGRR